MVERSPSGPGSCPTGEAAKASSAEPSIPNAKHTPGPWRVGMAGPNLCPTVGTECGLMTAMVAHGNNHPTEANARLIAAAPELYEALEALMAFDGARGTYDASKAYDAKQAAEKALAKARGQA